MEGSRHSILWLHIFQFVQVAEINLVTVNMCKNDQFFSWSDSFSLLGLFLGHVQEQILLVDELSPCLVIRSLGVPLSL